MSDHAYQAEHPEECLPQTEDDLFRDYDRDAIRAGLAGWLDDRLNSRENMMTETREFPTEVIASLSSGVLFCQFSDMHKAAEHLMGHPIWTHHFASKDLWKSMQAAILGQHPDMPVDAWDVTPENLADKIAALHRNLGARVSIEGGYSSTAKSPLDGLPEGKPAVFLSV